MTHNIARKVLVLLALLSLHLCWKKPAPPSTSADAAIWFGSIILVIGTAAEREGVLGKNGGHNGGSRIEVTNTQEARRS